MAGYHGRFIWYELITTDMAAASAFYSRGCRLERAGRIPARSRLHGVLLRNDSGERPDGPAAGGAPDGRDPKVDGLRQRR